MRKFRLEVSVIYDYNYPESKVKKASMLTQSCEVDGEYLEKDVKLIQSTIQGALNFAFGSEHSTAICEVKLS